MRTNYFRGNFPTVRVGDGSGRTLVVQEMWRIVIPVPRHDEGLGPAVDCCVSVAVVVVKRRRTCTHGAGCVSVCVLMCVYISQCS